jgi:opacity protein-like surface antigen
MLKKIAVAATLAMLASTSFAADRAPIYVGTDLGTSEIDDFAGRTTGYGAYIGYALTPTFAIELGYRNLGKFEEGNVVARVHQSAASIVAGLPVATGVNVYGRLGFNHISAQLEQGSARETESRGDFLMGLGASYDITKEITARAEFQKVMNDANNFSVGVSVKF